MTRRELELVEALRCKVRYFSMTQVARTWWSGTSEGTRRARQRMKLLAKSGWVTIARVLARPLLDLESPLYCWRPGGASPDFKSLSKLIRTRWTLPAQATDIVLPGPQTIALFGALASGAVRNLCQTTHDLHVAAIYLHYRRYDPAVAGAWVGEDSLSQSSRGHKLPDAIIRDVDGNPIQAVEFGGSYSPQRLQAFWQRLRETNSPP